MPSAQNKKKRHKHSYLQYTHSQHLVPLIGNQQQDVPVKDRRTFEMIYTCDSYENKHPLPFPIHTN